MKNIIHWLFKLIHNKHFNQKNDKGQYMIKKIIKVKGSRTAIVENYYGNRTTEKFYFKLGKYYI